MTGAVLLVRKINPDFCFLYPNFTVYKFVNSFFCIKFHYNFIFIIFQKKALPIFCIRFLYSIRHNNHLILFCQSLKKDKKNQAHTNCESHRWRRSFHRLRFGFKQMLRRTSVSCPLQI